MRLATSRDSGIVLLTTFKNVTVVFDPGEFRGLSHSEAPKSSLSFPFLQQYLFTAKPRQMRTLGLRACWPLAHSLRHTCSGPQLYQSLSRRYLSLQRLQMKGCKEGTSHRGVSQPGTSEAW